MLSNIFINLFLAMIFGAAIGLERESSKKGRPHVGGIRTFALMALAGALAGIFLQNSYTLVGSILVIGFVLLLIANYVAEALETKSFGITSELSALATFFIGLLVMIEIIPLQATIALLVMLVFILSLKSRTAKWVEDISTNEMESFISYAIIALVALPVLPDHAYQVKDIPVLPQLLRSLGSDGTKFNNLDLINPHKIWIVVVLITGIDVFGYVLGKAIGNKNGLALTSFMAGFVSSTSATQSLAQRSAKSVQVLHLVGAAVLANLASFLQIFLLVGPLNSQWMVAITPGILVMIIVASGIAYFHFKQQEPAEAESNFNGRASKMFSLLPALKFAGLLIVIKIVTKICLIEFGHSGFIISSLIASFAGIDAILVNLAEMAGQSITFSFAFITFLAVNATNLLSKSFYSYLQGNKQFALRFFISMLVIIAVSLVGLAFV